MAKLAVIGLGAMGSRIAGRLHERGHELVVWNRDPAKTEPLTALGASAAETPADAARRADAVITMLSGPQALREVTEGASGVAAAASGSTTVIQMSTVGPASVSRLASLLPNGTGLLDAPVLGSVSEAETGTLQIFAGGPPELVEHWKPVLSDLGTVLHVGPAGAGTAAKLVANSTLFSVLTALGEALALAQALGLEQKAAFEVLAGTPLAAQAERRRPAIETGDFPPRFALSLARKDADLILEAAAASAADLRLAAAAQAWLADAEEDGRSDEDYSAVLARILGSA